MESITINYTITKEDFKNISQEIMNRIGDIMWEKFIENSELGHGHESLVDYMTGLITDNIGYYQDNIDAKETLKENGMEQNSNGDWVVKNWVEDRYEIDMKVLGYSTQSNINTINIKKELLEATCEFWIEWNYMVGRPGYENREEWLD